MKVDDFHPELFPLQSPLLGESCLVSYPPLTDMLKFSGYPSLTSGLDEEVQPEPCPRSDKEPHEVNILSHPELCSDLFITPAEIR